MVMHHLVRERYVTKAEPSSYRPRRCPPGRAPGEDAAAEEGAFQRAVAVHPAAAEAGCLARGVEAGERLAVRAEDAGGEVRLQSPQRLAGEDGEADGDERAGLRVQDAVRPGHADQLVAPVVAGDASRRTPPLS